MEKINEELEKEILDCKYCNVTKDVLYAFPKKDKFEFDNFCMFHKEKLIRFDERKETIKLILKHRECINYHMIEGNKFSCLDIVLKELKEEK